jgi:hypothetical protein
VNETCRLNKGTCNPQLRDFKETVRIAWYDLESLRSMKHVCSLTRAIYFSASLRCRLSTCSHIPDDQSCYSDDIESMSDAAITNLCILWCVEATPRLSATKAVFRRQCREAHDAGSKITAFFTYLKISTLLKISSFHVPNHGSAARLTRASSSLMEDFQKGALRKASAHY